MASLTQSPSQHNSTLTISPLVSNRRQDFFATPQNPTLFNTPGSNNNLTFLTTSTFDPHPLANAAAPLSQAEKLRLWRHDAWMQHHYKTAEYVGDKVLALTGDPNDAFWLAQVHYASGNYVRARQLLLGKQFDASVSCRYLGALCLTQLGQWDEALDVLGEVNPFSDAFPVKNQDGGIKLEASMCYLRGRIFARQNAFERAKECYKEAVMVDIKCFEAFAELVENHLMAPQEEWEFLAALTFDDDDELVRLLYTTRLNKYMHLGQYEDAAQRLRDEYSLGDNCDVMLSRADLLFVQCKFQACLEVCEAVLRRDRFNFSVLPNYLSCLHELGGKNKLFLMAHKLAENHPTSHVTWLAVGVYYLSIGKIPEARRYFSKSSLINPNFAQAWIGFAHTFAAEGEHEQAISTYATAARLFPGTHLPNLFLGMQYLQMNNLVLAEEYLATSYSICSTDPLLLNEMGVIHYHKSDLKKAEFYFNQALAAAKYLNADSKAWFSIHANLGHVYRRLGQFDKSLHFFHQVLRVGGTDANIHSAIGLVHLKMGAVFQAIDTLHDALAIAPNDPVASDLLKRALEENMNGENEALRRTSSLKPRKQRHSMQTPLVHKSRSRMEHGNSLLSDDVNLLANDLHKGEDSSDDDDAIMDIESD
ncbi:hypothetical protein BABINDRAFT_172314 [Babjeviella inositovora NRRL Y-12698]|uniref:Uncharacterized protein n=1 Tax=Babjeviella inositovora NRRL Y-12698 TaxID=984486 RepID=A0A1E3QLV3_9ASCO|nr:uncharacterized protein BABINDRAFT_172314 [Babjeviella inositovora NRRL Y-12698]ODQ78598.1 hypothetical protein BABINDRAFT_172314 [Babjeviella inositovora NRRL Y-12698]